MVGINEGMCVVYFKLCLMFVYVVKWYTLMSHNNNNITWCYKLFIIFIIFITKLYNIIIHNIIIYNIIIISTYYPKFIIVAFNKYLI